MPLAATVSLQSEELSDYPAETFFLMDVMSTSSSHHSQPIFSRKGVTTHKKRNMETCSNMFSLGIRTSSNYMWTYLIPTMSESGGSKILVTQKHVAFFELQILKKSS